MLGEVLTQVLAFDLKAVTGLVLRRSLDHGAESRGDVEVAYSHGVGVRDDRIGRVAVDLGRVAPHDGPFG